MDEKLIKLPPVKCETEADVMDVWRDITSMLYEKEAHGIAIAIDFGDEVLGEYQIVYEGSDKVLAEVLDALIVTVLDE